MKKNGKIIYFQVAGVILIYPPGILSGGLREGWSEVAVVRFFFICSVFFFFPAKVRILCCDIVVLHNTKTENRKV